MSEEKNIKLNNEQLNAVTGGDYAPGSDGYTIYDPQGNTVGASLRSRKRNSLPPDYAPAARNTLTAKRIAWPI